MKGKQLHASLTVVILLSFAFVPVPASTYATPTTEAVFSIIEYDGTFTYAPGYRPAELPPEYRVNPPLILPGDRYARDEVILRFKPEVTRAQRDALMALHGLRHGRPMWGERAFVAKVAAGNAVTVTRALLHNPLLEIASLNPVIELDGELNNGSSQANAGMTAPTASSTSSEDIPCIDDPLAPLQQHLGANKINACEAWLYSKGLGPVSKIAIIDSGIDATDQPTPGPSIMPHPDFADKFLEENWIAFEDVGEPFKDYSGHGTHVAGLAMAGTNNGIGVAGVGYTAWPMSLKVVDDCLTGQGTHTNIASAMRWAADHGASVINMSAGLPSDVTDELGDGSIQVVREAVEYAYSRGLTIVATAGNAGTERLRYPAAFGEAPQMTLTQRSR